MKTVTALMLANQGDRLPVSAFPVDGTYPTATAQWEKRNVATEIPVWDSALCIQCNKCALVCPHAAIRVKVYDPDRLAAAPSTFKARAVQGARFHRPVHRPGRAGRLHRLLALRDDVPGEGQGQSAPQGDRHDAAGAAARVRADQLRLLPRPARGRSHARQARREEHAVPAAALRVLGRVRRLRRDAVHQADDAALRRPCGHRQRHRLLVHLRRQPADDALHREPRRARAGMGQLALRGQRRVRLRPAALDRPARAARAGAGRAVRARRCRPGSPKGCSAPIRHRSARSPTSVAASRNCAASCAC